MATRIAVLADLHYGAGPMPGGRRGEIADILLLRAVKRLRRSIRPHAVVILGDLLDDGAGTGGEGRYRTLKRQLERLRCPLIVLPGNHDADLGRFHEFFPRPPEWIDVGDVRLLPFVDREEPGYNARRTILDLLRLRRARSGHQGPLVTLQHSSLFPPGMHDCPYNLTNAELVIQEMKDTGVSLSIGGHYHPGFQLERDGIDYLCCPGLCEAPFRFLEVTIDDGRVEVEQHQLQLPPELGLVDCHCHSEFAYCSENMEVQAAARLAEAFGLRGLVFAEHSGHLYFSREDYWSGAAYRRGISGARPELDRMQDYLQFIDGAAGSNYRIGLEIDSDYNGEMLVRRDDMRRAQFIIGSIHDLPVLRRDNPSVEEAAAEFLALQRRFLTTGIQVLAHPFRVFRHAGLEAPERLYQPTVDMLRENGVAAEINFKGNTPDPAFFRACLKGGVKLSLASDAHNLAELGDLAPHLRLLRRLGYNEGDLGEIVIDPMALD